MIRILNAEPLNYSREAKHILRSIGELDEQELTRRELISCLHMYHVLIVRLKHQVDQKIIDAGKRLKAIVTATTGLDHIDVNYALTRGITVLSLKGETEFLRTISATAEHTWSMLLSLIRRIPQAFESVRRGEWNRDTFRGNEICGKRLGIVGLGRTGEKVAQYGTAFGMQIHAWDPHRTDWLPGVIRERTLNDLLQISDVFSLHIPLNEQTRAIISHEELQLLPDGAILLNTARGDLINSQALLEALTQGKLAGAALDVIPGERDPKNKKRLNLIEYTRTHSNLLLTPHIGGATTESMAKAEIFMAKKLVKWLQAMKT
jgi:D-3-phosphoglycerate dehydrogenase